MKELVTLLQNVGFPIAVAIYLLWRYDKRLEEMTEVLNKICTKMEVIKNTLSGDSK